MSVLSPFPLADVFRMKWPQALVNWMQEIQRIVTGEQNEIHLGKTALTEIQDIGGAVGKDTNITWDTELRKDSEFSHSNTSNRGRVQVNTTGRYYVYVNIAATSGGAAGFNCALRLWKNSGILLTRGASYGYTYGTWCLSMQLNTEIELEAGDYIEARTEVYNAGGSYVVNTVSSECEFIMKRIE